MQMVKCKYLIFEYVNKQLAISGGSRALFWKRWFFKGGTNYAQKMVHSSMAKFEYSFRVLGSSLLQKRFENLFAILLVNAADFTGNFPKNISKIIPIQFLKFTSNCAEFLLIIFPEIFPKQFSKKFPKMLSTFPLKLPPNIFKILSLPKISKIFSVFL